MWRRLRSLGNRAALEDGLDEEMRFHVDQQTEKNQRAGMTAGEALRHALLTFGGVEHARETTRDEFRATQVEDAIRDVRYALRTLGRSPGFTLVTVITLAIGIGATTAVFSLVNGILLQPLPYAESDRLVALKHSAPGLGVDDAGMSDGIYFHYAAHAASLDSLALYVDSVGNVGADGSGTERVHITYAGPDLFQVLRVTPVLGRLFTTEDGAPGFMNVKWTVPILISYDFWQSRYGGDPGVIGRVIALGETPRVILGVTPEGFEFPRPETQIWMLSFPSPDRARLAASLSYSAVGRLQPGVTPATAEAELSSLLPRIEGTLPDATPDRMAFLQLSPLVVPLRDDVIGATGTMLWPLFGGMAFLLLVACANVANLFLVRSEGRDREIAVRKALGAGTTAIARLVLSEAFVLTATGAVLGWLIARGAVALLVAFTPIDLPRLGEVGVDGTALTFTVMVATLTGLVFGGLSLRRQSATAGHPAGFAGGVRTTTSGRGPQRLRHGLVAAQVALALTLLAGSALMLQSFWRLTHVEPGFAPDAALTVEVGMPGNRAIRHQSIYGELLDRVRALPGVLSATAASFVPLAGAEHVFPVAIGPARESASGGGGGPVPLKFIMPGYFQTMGMRVLEGSTFEMGGVIDAPRPVWVSAALARRLFPGESAIGKQVRRLESNGEEVRIADPATRTIQPVLPFTIAGVVADAAEESLRNGPSDIVYIPVLDPVVERSIVPTNMTLVIRTDDAPMTPAPSVRRVIQELDPALSVARVRTLASIVSASTATETFLAVLLLFGAAASLFLGAIGVYGVVAQTVRRRTREIGVRIALGAQHGDVVRMILREAVVVVLVGVAIGVATTLATTRALQSFLFGVGPADPFTLVGVAALLCGVGLTAALLPSRRAARINPVAALQAE